MELIDFWSQQTLGVYGEVEQKDIKDKGVAYKYMEIG